MGWQSVRVTVKVLSAFRGTLGIKTTKTNYLPLLLPALHLDARGQGAGGHKDMGGSCPHTLKVPGLAGINGSIPGLGLFHTEGVPCIPPGFPSTSVSLCGPGADIRGWAQLQGQNFTIHQLPQVLSVNGACGGQVRGAVKEE